MPEPVPAAPVMPEAVPAAPVMPEAVPVAPVEASAPVIYGGASPVVNDINLNQDQPHQIYGGADPLENTQPIPAVQTIQAVQPVAPVPNPVMAAPDVAPAAPVQQ